MTKAEQRAADALSEHAEFGKLNLVHIRKNVARLLGLIGRDGIFTEYTLHDFSHIEAMLGMLDWLIPKATQDAMTPADWLLIVLSCYFHDAGMLVTGSEYAARGDNEAYIRFRDNVLLGGDDAADYTDRLSQDEDERERFFYQEFVRSCHAERAAYWVEGNASSEFGATHETVDAIEDLLGGLNEMLRGDVALVCRSHHLDDLDDLQRYRLRRGYGPELKFHFANLQYAALLLRTTDLLHVTTDRVPSVLFKLTHPTDPVSRAEWAKQRGVTAVVPAQVVADGQADTIEVHAQFHEPDGFFGLTSYLAYAADQLTQTHAWAAHGKAPHQFPWRTLDTDQIETVGFLSGKYKFEVDEARVIDLLTGHTLYNDTRVVVRELAQNALDAVRFRHHTHRNEDKGHVEIEWHSSERTLVVRDTGVGMTQDTVEKHFLTVGSSYYRDAKVEEAHPDFSPISRFGIGVLSTFMVSDDVQVLTVHPDEPDARRLSLPNAKGRYLIQLLPKDDAAVQRIGPHGTEVRLRVRSRATLDDVLETARHWIVIPGCDVTVTVDGGEPARVGHESVKAAVQTLWADAYDGDTRVVATADGSTQVAFGVWWLRYFDIWEFGRRRSEEDSERPEWPGTCVEGIRVGPGFLGWREEPGLIGPLAGIANICGVSQLRTNVARSGLEQSPELDGAVESVYRAAFGHVASEHSRQIEGRKGPTHSAYEAQLLRSQVTVGTTHLALAEAMGSELPIVVVEHDSGPSAISKASLDTTDRVWIVESPVITAIDGLVSRLNLATSATAAIQNLRGGSGEDIPTPRLLGSSDYGLQDREIAAVTIDAGAERLDLCFTPGGDRWLRRDVGLVTLSGGGLAVLDANRRATPIADWFDDPDAAADMERLLRRETVRNFGHRGTTASSYDVAGRVTVDANDYVGITWRGSDYWFAHANRTQLLAECADGRERSRWCLLLPVMAALASLGGVNRASVYEFFREHGPGGGLDSARVDAIADDELHLFDVRALTRRSSSATMDSGDE